MHTMHFIMNDRKNNYHGFNIDKCEDYYKSAYVGDWCIKTKHGWSEMPVAVFYQPNPNYSKGHKKYFGLLIQNGGIMITDATSAFSEPIYGVSSKNGEVVVSRYRHDYRTSMDGTVSVDGGRDYLKTIFQTEDMDSGLLYKVEVIINDDKFSFVPKIDK